MGGCPGAPSRGRSAAGLEVFRLKYLNPDLTCSERDLVPVRHPTGSRAANESPAPRARSFPRGSADSRGAGPRCPRSAPLLPADPPAGVPRGTAGPAPGPPAAPGRCGKRPGPCPWPRGPAGRCRLLFGPAERLEHPRSDARNEAIGAAGPGRAGRAAPGGRGAGPALRPGARLRPRIDREKRIRGARGAEGPRRPAEAPGTCCCASPGSAAGPEGGLGADPVSPGSVTGAGGGARHGSGLARPGRTGPAPGCPGPGALPPASPRPPRAVGTGAGRAPVPPAPPL